KVPVQENPSEKQNQSQTPSLPLADLYVNKEDNLNPRYTFDSFVVGSFNELAYAGAQAIINSPGMAYNPFFIYGSSGLGKTHIIQGIGNTIKKMYPEKQVYYMTLEKFSLEFTTAVQLNKINLFKERFRKYDVFIIDDIQFITSKTKTQEELFHVFNALYDSNKQIIFSSDKHPNFITGLEDRLKSRFSQGMIVEVLEPDFESRLAILKNKLVQQHVLLEPDIVEYIAQTVEGNIREIEGNANAVMMQSVVKKRPLSINEVKQLLKNTVKPKKQISLEEIIKTIADFYNIDPELLYEKTRRKEVVHVRQMTMYVLREEFNISFPLIGQKLGGKDHTTVIHSCEKIKQDLSKNPSIVEELEKIKILFK
ncbi:MAG: chromosomal replication initiator protein DnaA, partial [Minisyncoccia bacterium]